MAAISVLIVTYRTSRLTTAAVLSALSVAEVAEVMVIDNGDDPETPAALDAIDDVRLHYARNAGNDGYGSAANQAAALATSSNLLFLNSDAELTSRAANELIAEVSRFEEGCIAGPRLVDADGEVQRSPGLLPGPFDLTIRALGLHLVARRTSHWPVIGRAVRGSGTARNYESAVTATKPIDTSMVSGAVWAIGASAFHGLGGFDERFFLYFEDADLCRRALRAGMAIRYVPDAVVTHIGGASSSEDYHFGPRHARSMRQYLAKWYGPPGAALAVVLMFLRAVGFSVGAPRKAGRAWRAVAATVGFGGGA